MIVRLWRHWPQYDESAYISWDTLHTAYQYVDGMQPDDEDQWTHWRLP